MSRLHARPGRLVRCWLVLLLGRFGKASLILSLERCAISVASPRNPGLEWLRTWIASSDWTALTDDTWRTPLGDLRFGWDSFGAAEKAAEHSWFLRLWEKDPKTRPEPSSYLGFRAARQHSLRPTRFPLRVVTACATDAIIGL